MIRESQQDQFAPISRRGTFKSRHLWFYDFPFTNQFSLSRRGSETTVGTTVSGTVSDAMSNKRFSASTIATTLTIPTSSDTLHAQFKRFRADSRSSSFRSGSIPSARSSVHPSNTQAQRLKYLPPTPRDFAPNPEEHHPPLPAVPQRVFTHQLFTDPSPLPLSPSSVIEAGALAQQLHGRDFDDETLVVTSTESGNLAELRICLPSETGDEMLSVINEHASDAGSTILASPRPSVDRRQENYELLVDTLGSRQTSEGPSIFERDTSPLESSASALSLRELLMRDRPSQDNSDIEDTMSDVTDHTDLSLIEAFETSPTPFHPALLSVLMSLKEEVVDRIKQRLQVIMLQAHGSQERPSGPNTSTSSQPGRSAGREENPSFLSALPTLRKRPSDEDDGVSGRGNGDDRDGRKRQNITTRAQLEVHLRKFACPFHKRYPDSNGLSKSCRAPGWSSVHRVK